MVYLLYISIKSRLKKTVFLSFSAGNAQHFLPSYRLSSSYTYQENHVLNVLETFNIFALISIVTLLYISIKSRLKNLFLSFSARNAQHFLPSYRLSSSYTYQENRVSTSRFFVSFSARYPYHFLTSYRLSISYAYRENRVWKQRFLSFSAKDVQHFLPLYRLTISYTYRENWLKNIFFTDLSLFK